MKSFSAKSVSAAFSLSVFVLFAHFNSDSECHDNTHFATGRFFGNWTEIVTLIGKPLSADNGLVDQTGNGIECVPLNGVRADNIKIEAIPQPGFLDIDDDLISLGHSAALRRAFRSSHEQHILIAIEDGQVEATYDLYGVLDPKGGSVRCYVEPNGRLNFSYSTQTAGNIVNWQSYDSDVIPDGDAGLLHLRVSWDFEIDTVLVWKNGTEVPGIIRSGNISDIDPWQWDSNLDFYVGALNDAGVATRNPQPIHHLRFAITGLGTPQESLDYFATGGFSDRSWQSKYHITFGNAELRREFLREQIFREYPTNAVPISRSTVMEGKIHGWDVNTELVGWHSITKLQFDRNGIHHYTYHIRKESARRLIIYIMGHSPIRDNAAINCFLEAGFDVMLCTMPDTGDQEDLSDNAVSLVWKPRGGGNHNEMSVLGVSGLQYFFFDKIEALNYIEENFCYDQINVTGISGGGWTALWLAALDPRLKNSFPIRGFKPRIFKCYPNPTDSDYEQGGRSGLPRGGSWEIYDLYTTNTYEDLVVLATSHGRLLFCITHADDSAKLGGISFNKWRDYMRSRALPGGEYRLFLNTNPEAAKHQIVVEEVDKVLETLIERGSEEVNTFANS